MPAAAFSRLPFASHTPRPHSPGGLYEVIFDTVPDYNPYRKHWNIYNMGS